MKMLAFRRSHRMRCRLARELHYSTLPQLEVFPMSAIGDVEFLRLLKKDIDYFASAIERFEDLIPRVCSPVQDQWRLQAQTRRNFAIELEILLEKAEHCVSASLNAAQNKSHTDSASQ
jgi:hypothetical protein